jgi:hypothetical protein
MAVWFPPLFLIPYRSIKIFIFLRILFNLLKGGLER